MIWFGAILLAPTVIGVLPLALWAHGVSEQAIQTRYHSHMRWFSRIGFFYVPVNLALVLSSVALASPAFLIAAVVLAGVFMLESLVGLYHALSDHPHRVGVTAQFTQ